MTEKIQLGGIPISVTRKNIKHVHLSVHPPDGRVTLVAPTDTRPEVARAYAVSKLGWIRKQQAQLREQAREAPREYVERESHYVWGKRYLLTVNEEESKPSVRMDHRTITLAVRPGSTQDRREAVMQAWHRSLLHQVVPGYIAKWEPRLRVRVAGYSVRRMKTRWGSCNPGTRRILINSELVKKPQDLLEYVVVHEMIHLVHPTHSQQFLELLGRHWPGWREARAELNELPLGAERWQGWSLPDGVTQECQ